MQVYKFQILLAPNFPIHFIIAWDMFKMEDFFKFLNFFCIAAGLARDLSTPTGIKPVPPAVEVWSPNHWTTREVPIFCFKVSPWQYMSQIMFVASVDSTLLPPATSDRMEVGSIFVCLSFLVHMGIANHETNSW